MPTPRRNASTSKRYLPQLQLSIDSSLYQHQWFLDSPTSSISSARASVATSVETSSTYASSPGVFYVRCLYDFDAADSDQLSFKRHEVLNILQQEESGWWAAVREHGDKVGWIPSAYVDPISEEKAARLRRAGDLESLAGQRPHTPKRSTDGAHHNNVLTSLDKFVHRFHDTAKDLPATPSVSDEAKLSAVQQNLDLPPMGGTLWPCPPSPTSPMPCPRSPPRSAVLMHSKSIPSHPRPQRSATSPFPASHRPQSASLQISRHLRGRPVPVLIDDTPSLSRLSVLFESNNVEEVDFLANSPDAESALSRFSRLVSPRPDKVKQITGDDEAQAFHDAKLALANSPWFLRPIYGDEDIKLESDGGILAGTLPALVERLTIEPLKVSQELKYRHAFLTTFKTFATAEELFNLLLERYHIEPPPKLTIAELSQWKDNRLLPTQKRVLMVLKTWLEDHRLVQDEAPIARRLQDFLCGITAPVANAATAKQMMKSLERITFAMPTSPTSAGSASPRRRKKKESKNELSKMCPVLVAEHLCLHEHRVYSKVHAQECLDWIKARSGPPVANLAAFCALHDKLATWVKMSILYNESLAKRANIVDFWIKVAEKCKSLNNFSSLSAVVTALSSSVVSTLSLTWAHAGRSGVLDELVKYNDPRKSFAAYRTLQQNAEGPCVPFIPMYLTDIIHVNEQHLDNTVISATSNKTMVNFIKRQKWYDTLTAILRHQEKKYCFVEDPATTSFIEANLIHAGEQDTNLFWSKSQEVQQAEMSHADIRKGLVAAGF